MATACQGDLGKGATASVEDVCLVARCYHFKKACLVPIFVRVGERVTPNFLFAVSEIGRAHLSRHFYCRPSSSTFSPPSSKHLISACYATCFLSYLQFRGWT